MLLASYVDTRDGIIGVGNILIRLRIAGWQQAFQLRPDSRFPDIPRASHTELVFEPSDGVAELFPDHSLEEKAGTLWGLSSVGLERVPEWSVRRSGALGGVRRKRINFNSGKWKLTKIYGFSAYEAAKWAKENEGVPYDWRLVASKLVWLLPNSEDTLMCNECVLTALGVKNAYLFDPCSTDALIEGTNRAFLSSSTLATKL
jgi:hypothetical protein